MPKRPALLTPPARLPKVRFVTEAQLAHLVRVTPETLRSWRRRGEMPPIAVGPEVQEFIAGIKGRGPSPICYEISAVSAWLFGTGGKGGRPKELPASTFDPEADRTSHIRMAAEGTPGPEEKKKLLRQLSDQAKFAARLGFSSPTEYEDWLKRGAPEDELPPECRRDEDATLVDDESSERLQLRSDAAIAKMRGVSLAVVTAERHRAEPPPPEPPVEPSHSWRPAPSHLARPRDVGLVSCGLRPYGHEKAIVSGAAVDVGGSRRRHFGDRPVDMLKYKE